MCHVWHFVLNARPSKLKRSLAKRTDAASLKLEVYGSVYTHIARGSGFNKQTVVFFVFVSKEILQSGQKLKGKPSAPNRTGFKYNSTERTRLSPRHPLAAHPRFPLNKTTCVPNHWYTRYKQGQPPGVFLATLETRSRQRGIVKTCQRTRW